MRRSALLIASALLLAAPTVLAFFSGGYFAQPRLWAAVGAWAVVLLVAFAAPRAFPSSVAGRLVIAALAAMTLWSAISLLWAPLAGPAVDSVERLLLYLGALLVATALLREGRIAAALEPVLAFGALTVIGEGLCGRLLPGLVTLDRSRGAGSRLEQPITYWNAEGALAAVGLVLCARLAGDRERPAVLRALGAAACVPLGAGVYLSFSRGAIAAVVLGLVILTAMAPNWSQLRGAGLALGAAALAATVAGLTPGVASLSGTLADREREGAVVLAALVAIMILAGILAAWVDRAERRGRLPTRALPLARRLPAVAAVAGALIAGALVVASLQEHGHRSRLGTSASRFASASSNRYEYWRVGLRAFGDHPLHGVGAGGFRVEWLRERPVAEGVLDVHSLELEALSELGLVGFLALGLLVGGVAAAAREAMRRRPGFAAGPIAASSAWLLHASIDWDWQLPAFSLLVVIMAGALIAASESSAEPIADEPWMTRDVGLPRAVSATAGQRVG